MIDYKIMHWVPEEERVNADRLMQTFLNAVELPGYQGTLLVRKLGSAGSIQIAPVHSYSILSIRPRDDISEGLVAKIDQALLTNDSHIAGEVRIRIGETRYTLFSKNIF